MGWVGWKFNEILHFLSVCYIPIIQTHYSLILISVLSIIFMLIWKIQEKIIYKKGDPYYNHNMVEYFNIFS